MSQRNCGGDHFQVGDKTVLGVTVALDGKAKHTAVPAAAKLAGGEFVLRMRFQARIVDVRDLGVAFKEPRNLLGAFLVALQAQRQGDGATLDEPGVERRDCPAHINHGVRLDGLDQLCGSGNRSPHRVPVTIDVLGQRLHREVCTVLERAIQRGRREGRIHTEEGAIIVSNLRQSRYVRSQRSWVGDGLRVDEARVGAQSRAHSIQVSHVHESPLDPVLLWEDLLK